MSSAITPWLYPAWLLYQFFSNPVPGISGVPAAASCPPAETLPAGQDRKAPSMSAGSHLLCSSLQRLFFTSFVPFHSAPGETSLFPLSLPPAGHHSLLSALLSPGTTHILRGSGAEELGNSRFLTTNKKCQWLLCSSAPLLAPSRGAGWDHKHQCTAGQRCCCLLTSGCVSGACGMYQVPPCGDTENGLLHKGRGSISKPPSLPYICFSCVLYFPSRVLERSCRADAG